MNNQFREKRLTKEYKQILETPVENVSAVPLETNINEWHVNITPFDRAFNGVVFHLIMRFPSNYPNEAPKISICHHISHPNVFGNYLCLDMLTMSPETIGTPYRGWSVAYTVRSILVQLQSFLFDLDGFRDYDLKQMISAAKSFRCRRCGHNGSLENNHFPQIVSICQEVFKIKSTVQETFKIPRFYKTVKKATVREECSIGSAVVGVLEIGTIVSAISIVGKRLEINHPVSGWCSVVSSKSGNNICKYVKTERCELLRPVRISALNKKYDSMDLETGNLVAVQKFEDSRACIVWPTFGTVLYFSERKENIFQVVEEEEEEEEEEEDDHTFGEEEEEISKIVDFFDAMFDVVQSIIFEFCDYDTLVALKTIHPEFDRIFKLSVFLMRSQFRCFYTLEDLNNSDAILGVGVQPFIMDKRSRVTGIKRKCLQQIHPSFDILSYKGFKLGVSHSVWKDREFSDFLPLYINSEHGTRSIALAQTCMTDMWKQENKNVTGNPGLYLTTLAKLMNTTVVDMMKKYNDLGAGEIQLFDSIKALEGYASFYHLLLALVEEFPSIKNIANERVQRFITGQEFRDKEVTPDIGDLLVYVAVSDYSWDEVVVWYVDESMQRNARWILAKYPGLRHTKGETMSCVRLHQSYKATATGKRLAMFQVFFMDEIASPKYLDDLEEYPNKLKFLLKDFNSRCGKPPKGLAEKLQAHSRRVLASSGWLDYFSMVRFPCPTSLNLCAWLRNCIELSSCRKYHDIQKILRYTEHHREEPNFKLHLKATNCYCSDTVFDLALDHPENSPLVVKGNKIDVVFCFDVTGSMDPALEQAKTQMKKIIKDIGSKTQSKKVRFGIVAYRDVNVNGKNPGAEGIRQGERFLFKEFPLNADVGSLQGFINKLVVDGGGDGPEEMCGALDLVAKMTWDEDALRICIIIADAVPHGVGYRGDAYPIGSPLKHKPDSVRIVRTMAQSGIVTHVVDCGAHTGEAKCFFHGLARIGKGVCVELAHCESLAQIATSAALEEKALNDLAQKILPVYQHVLQRHPTGRFQQHCYEVHATLKSKNIKVNGYMNSIKLSESVQEAVDSIAYCTDVNQVRAFIKKEHMPSFDSSKHNYFSETTKHVTMVQVKRCLEHLSEKIKLRDLFQKGCQYRQQSWSAEVCQPVFDSFCQEQNIKYEPWAPLTAQDRKKCEVEEVQRLVKSHRFQTKPKIHSKTKIPLTNTAVDCWSSHKIRPIPQHKSHQTKPKIHSKTKIHLTNTAVDCRSGHQIRPIPQHKSHHTRKTFITNKVEEPKDYVVINTASITQTVDRNSVELERLPRGRVVRIGKVVRTADRIRACIFGNKGWISISSLDGKIVWMEPAVDTSTASCTSSRSSESMLTFQTMEPGKYKICDAEHAGMVFQNPSSAAYHRLPAGTNVEITQIVINGYNNVMGRLADGSGWLLMRQLLGDPRQGAMLVENLEIREWTISDSTVAIGDRIFFLRAVGPVLYGDQGIIIGASMPGKVRVQHIKSGQSNGVKLEILSKTKPKSGTQWTISDSTVAIGDRIFFLQALGPVSYGDQGIIVGASIPGKVLVKHIKSGESSGVKLEILSKTKPITNKVEQPKVYVVISTASITQTVDRNSPELERLSRGRVVRIVNIVRTSDRIRARVCGNKGWISISSLDGKRVWMEPATSNVMKEIRCISKRQRAIAGTLDGTVQAQSTNNPEPWEPKHALKQKWQVIQRNLKRQLITSDTFSLENLSLVGGVDISFSKTSKTLACVSLVVMSYPECKELYEINKMVTLTHPYIPGFLAFREVDHCMAVLNDLISQKPEYIPQVILVDGNGILHYRGFGLASHYGVLANIPTIGIGKTLLCVNGLRLHWVENAFSRLRKKGDVSDLIDRDGNLLGVSLKTHDHSTKPIYVSIGHGISLETAIEISTVCCRVKDDIPEPVRMADFRGREVMDKLRNKNQRRHSRRNFRRRR